MDSDEEFDQIFAPFRPQDDEKKHLDEARINNEEEKSTKWTYLLIVGVVIIIILIFLAWWTFSSSKPRFISTIELFNAIRDPPME